MKKIKFGVVVFPGSNCDHDAYYALKKILDFDVTFLWHKDTDLKGIDAVVLPGGFSYGDYLRSGAIAKLSPIMNEVISFADRGGIVIGICNGFQILTESKLLPGALLKNDSLKFICKDVYLKTVNPSQVFTNRIPDGSVLKIPIAHGEGNYFAEPETILELEANGQIIFRYCDKEGNISPVNNPNGSINSIAGIINKKGNVLGMMPHPERVCDPHLGNTDGQSVFFSIASFLS